MLNDNKLLTTLPNLCQLVVGLKRKKKNYQQNLRKRINSRKLMVYTYPFLY